MKRKYEMKIEAIKTQPNINIELNKFNDLIQTETGKEKILYEQAKRAYEDSLKKFIIKNITGEDLFAETYKDAYVNACDLYDDLSGSEFVDELETLHIAITNHLCWIEVGQFDEMDDAQ